MNEISNKSPEFSVTQQNGGLTQDSSNKKCSLGIGQPMVGNQFSDSTFTISINTSIINRELKKESEIERNIKAFYDGLDESDKQFNAWFGVSVEKYTELLTTTDSWKSFDQKDIAAFLKAMERIEETAKFILYFKSGKDDYKSDAVRFLSNLESFLRSSNKVEKEIVDNLETMICIESLIFKTQYLRILGQNLEKLRGFWKKCDFNGSREETSESGNSIVGPKNESAADKKLKDAVEEIKSQLRDISNIYNHLQLVDNIEILLSLEEKDFDEKKRNLINQAKQCLYTAVKYYGALNGASKYNTIFKRAVDKCEEGSPDKLRCERIIAQNNKNYALELKLLKVLFPECYKYTLENHYKKLDNFEYNVYDIRDIAILNDLREATDCGLSKIKVIRIHCGQDFNPGIHLGNDNLTQPIYEFVEKYASEFKNLTHWTICRPDSEDLKIYYISKQNNEIGEIQVDGIVKQEKPEQIQERRSSSGSHGYILAGFALLIAIAIGVAAVNPDLMRHYLSLMGLILEQ